MEHRLKTPGAYQQKRAESAWMNSGKVWGTQLAVWGVERTCLFSWLSVKMNKCAPAVLMVFLSHAARFQYSSSIFPFREQLIAYVESVWNFFYRENVVNSVLHPSLCYICRNMITGAASHSLNYIMRHYSSGTPEHNMSVNVCFVNAIVLFKWQIHKMISLNEL